MSSAGSGLVGAEYNGRVRVLAPVALFVIFTATWLAMLPYGDIPLIDDWTYADVVQSILNGHYQQIPFVSANLMSQAYWGALLAKLFGLSYETLRIGTFCIAQVGLLSAYWLLRELEVAPLVAGLGALTLGCNPIYLSLSTTFMTDVPFTALTVLSLWVYVRGLRQDRAGLVVLAFFIAMVAVLDRQFGVVLGAAFAAGSLLRRRPSVLSVVLAAVPVVLLAAEHLLYQRWMVVSGRTSGFEAPVSQLLQLDLRGALAKTVYVQMRVVPFLGLCLVPVAALVGVRRGRVGLLWLLLGAGFAALLFWLLWSSGKFPPLLGDVSRPFGAGPLSMFDTLIQGRNQPEFAGQAVFWDVLTALACLSTAVLLAAAATTVVRLAQALPHAAARREMVPEAALLAYLASYLAAVFALGAMTSVYDRYLLPSMLPLLALTLLAARRWGRPRRWQIGLAAGLVAIMAAYGVAGGHDWLSWNRARWQATAFLAGEGVPPTRIDGGYEFNGVMLYHPGYKALPGKSWWWIVDDEYVVASGPIPGYRQIANFPVARWLWRHPEAILVLKRLEP